MKRKKISGYKVNEQFALQQKREQWMMLLINNILKPLLRVEPPSIDDLKKILDDMSITPDVVEWNCKGFLGYRNQSL